MAGASPEERAILERFQYMRSEVDQARTRLRSQRNAP
jgi:hypothetical protein